ncbi:very short patch repair endonuclease [Rhizobium fabae]|uniref:DNA mismatch endonuclease (Patch repair protein) n=1 Tax=Rhizobium fabae TaxID=573179 RepID=A0A7W6FJM3_9HYPH|nr:very short patch repair endonuclease [Rhizobium fabae]MBB3915576.1 DNA mismatch endonuclease (patch repair protein) [Rhizobium fabae]RUM11843.1 DNA mismatch endonuclease Vsr [Rhizobium fabae]
MADIVSPEKRSAMMAGIRGKDTKPEIAIRKALFALGWRYRIHDRRLPGKPDMVFPKRKAVIFIEGCFWHGHDCHLFKMPSSRPDFWHTKIDSNRQRDVRVRIELQKLGWRYLTVWECALKGRTRLPFPALIDTIVEWLESAKPMGEIEGVRDGAG